MKWGVIAILKVFAIYYIQSWHNTKCTYSETSLSGTFIFPLFYIYKNQNDNGLSVHKTRLDNKIKNKPKFGEGKIKEAALYDDQCSSES